MMYRTQEAARIGRAETIILEAAAAVIQLACLGSFVVFVSVWAGFIGESMR